MAVAINIAEQRPEPLTDINEVVPQSVDDQALFNDLYDVLKKHNALKRFGIMLLHQHFDIGSDEVLLETTDKHERTQLIQPVKKSDLARLDYIETSWRLDAGPKPLMACSCIKQGNDHSHQPRPSDVALKSNVEPLQSGLQKLMQLGPKTYHYRVEEYPNLRLPAGRQHGFIAQEIESVLPELVYAMNGEKDEHKSVDYVGLIPLLVAALQEQQRQIAELQAKQLG